MTTASIQRQMNKPPELSGCFWQRTNQARPSCMQRQLLKTLKKENFWNGSIKTKSNIQSFTVGLTDRLVWDRSAWSIQVHTKQQTTTKSKNRTTKTIPRLSCFSYKTIRSLRRTTFPFLLCKFKLKTPPFSTPFPRVHLVCFFLVVWAWRREAVEWRESSEEQAGSEIGWHAFLCFSTNSHPRFHHVTLLLQIGRASCRERV